METYRHESYSNDKSSNLLKTSTPKSCKRFIQKRNQNAIIACNQFEDVFVPDGRKSILFGDDSILSENVNSTHNSSQDTFKESDISNQASICDTKLKVENRDGRSISPTSSFNSSLNSSLSMTPDRLLRKYDLEFRDAISSDLNILMGKQILDSCKMDKEELMEHECDSFDKFVSSYKELVSWLRKKLDLFTSKHNCLSEQYANQSCGEEMLQKLTSRQNFKNYASRMSQIHPTATEDIRRRREEVDLLWSQLEEAINPNSKTKTHLLIFRDVEVDVDNLNEGIAMMLGQIDVISGELKTRNVSLDLRNRISSFILDIDRQFKCLTSITNVCNQMVKMESAVQDKFIEIHRQIPKMQQQCQSCYIQLLEWQLRLDSDQFVPRNISLEEIVEECDLSLYDESTTETTATLDRRVSTSAPSLQLVPFEHDLQTHTGNLTELEDQCVDGSDRLGFLRRTDAINNLTNLVKYSYVTPSLAFGKVNDESNAGQLDSLVKCNKYIADNELVDANQLHIINLDKKRSESCANGPYQDVGYSTGSKSPHSTENCSDSSGIMGAKEENLMDGIFDLKDPRRVLNDYKKFDKCNHQNLDHRCTDCDTKFNSSKMKNSQTESFFAKDSKTSSLRRKRKKKKVPTATLR